MNNPVRKQICFLEQFKFQIGDCGAVLVGFFTQLFIVDPTAVWMVNFGDIWSGGMSNEFWHACWNSDSTDFEQ